MDWKVVNFYEQPDILEYKNWIDTCIFATNWIQFNELEIKDHIETRHTHKKRKINSIHPEDLKCLNRKMYQDKGMEGGIFLFRYLRGGGHFSITELTHHTACHLPPDVTILRLHCSSESFSPLPKRLVLRMERNVEIFGPSDGCTRPESEPGGSSFCSLAATTLWPTVFLGANA